jgi:hypothetical protein
MHQHWPAGRQSKPLPQRAQITRPGAATFVPVESSFDDMRASVHEGPIERHAAIARPTSSSAAKKGLEPCFARFAPASQWSCPRKRRASGHPSITADSMHR